MNRIQGHKHNKDTFYYCLSIMLERASYYGLRSLIVLYMVGETIKMDKTEAFSIYGSWSITESAIDDEGEFEISSYGIWFLKKT